MRLITLFIGVMLFFGCEKSENRDCFKSTGGLTSKMIELGEFDEIFMGPHLKYVLIQSNENKLEVVGGKNVINFVEAKIEGGILKLNNINKCNFLRSYDKDITVYIHFKNIVKIAFEGTEQVTCFDELNLQDLVLTIRDGAGEFNLSLNANSLHTIVSQGWGNFNFEGNVNYLKLDVSGNGFGSSNALTVNDSILIRSNTVEDVQVNANNCFLRAETTAAGDIWYIGTPTSIIYHNYGTGALIDKN